MSIVTIRDFTEDDLGWMAALEVELFGAGAWSESLIREDHALGLRDYRCAEWDGERAGYAVWGPDGDVFHLMNIALDPAFRRRGIGRALMDDMFVAARARGERDVWLEVAVTNRAAILLYRKFGFKDVRVREKYYQPEGTDALVMRAVVAPEERRKGGRTFIP